MDYGVWTENSRGTYNKWDGVARSTTQVCLSLNFFLELLTMHAFCESTRKSWTGDCYTLI